MFYVEFFLRSLACFIIFGHHTADITFAHREIIAQMLTGKTTVFT